MLTTGELPHATGLTVSSVMVAEGVPPRLLALIGDDFLEDIRATDKFVLHVLGEGDRALSERFAGIRPSPGGLFAGLDVEQSVHGPIIKSIPTRAACTIERAVPTGHHVLIIGVIDSIEVGDLTDPLVYHRGRYRGLR